MPEWDEPAKIGGAPVVRRGWELRNNMTAYDAAFIAVAEVHELALVTADKKLASAPNIRCEIRLV